MASGSRGTLGARFVLQSDTRCGGGGGHGEGDWDMAEGRRAWGKVRQLPSGRYQASYILGSVRGGDQGTRYTALQTFDAKGDAWGGSTANTG